MALDPYSQSIVDRQDAAAAQAKVQRAQQPAQASAPSGLQGTGGRVYAGDQRSFTDYGPGLENELALRDKYNTEAEKRMFGYISGYGTRGGSAPNISRTSGPIAEKEAAAWAAAFGRAKDQAANVAQSALAGLRNTLARRGFGAGGGFADMKTAEALSPAANQLNEFGREQYIQDLNSAQQNANLEYSGGITQRGQTLQNIPQLLGLIRAGTIY